MNSIWRNVFIAFQGSDIDSGLSATDFSIMIGQQRCNETEIRGNSLVCRPTLPTEWNEHDATLKVAPVTHTVEVSRLGVAVWDRQGLAAREPSNIWLFYGMPGVLILYHLKSVISIILAFSISFRFCPSYIYTLS